MRKNNRRSGARNNYEVIVGNIGTVYKGHSARAALLDFEIYRAQSETRQGRAGGESVVALKNDEIWHEHISDDDFTEE